VLQPQLLVPVQSPLVRTPPAHLAQLHNLTPTLIPLPLLTAYTYANILFSLFNPFLDSNIPRLSLTQGKLSVCYFSRSQEEVAFMLGFREQDKGIKVCRDENFARTPSLQMALAYEAIYGRPVRELFAGLYQEIEREVAERAKFLTYTKCREAVSIQ
jgi:hypothetical protein